MKLTPVTKDYLWGGNKLREDFGKVSDKDIIAESWEVSVHKDGLSAVNGVPLINILEKEPTFIDKEGNPFPVLIKYIDAKQNLSVQVHPDDEYAKRVENDNGKTEMWYIVSADKGAGIYCGFKENTDKNEFLKKVDDGSVEELLNFIPVKSGDCYLIKAGTVHAIGAGCVILEVQQSSNVTYRVYDYNRVGADGKPRALHVDKAKEVINFNKFTDETFSTEYTAVKGGKIKHLTSCKYFKCRLIDCIGEYVEENKDTFTAVCVIEGQGFVNGESAIKGESFFVKNGEELCLNGKFKAILVTENR